jgi:diguanylate cyclase (GGDEF)-like protein/PAS domain S-box-containing protein
VELLVLGCSPDESNEYTKTLRNSGMAVHLATAVNPDQLTAALEHALPDLVLVNTDAEEVDFTTAIRQIRELSPATSFILLSDNPDQDLFFAAETRAQDIIGRNDHAHLIYAASREQQYVLARKELVALREELEQTLERCNLLTEGAQEAIAYVHDGMHVYANPVYLSLFGFRDQSELEGLPIMDLIAADDRMLFKSVLRKMDSNELQELEDMKIDCQSADGTRFKTIFSFSPATIHGEPCTQIVVRSELPEAELGNRLSSLSNRDPDTGLFTRKHFVGLLEEHLPQQNSVLLVNLRNLPDIRDRMGFDAGDNLLAESARTLNGLVYGSDVLARFGDHEFAIIATAGTDALSLANRLLKDLAEQEFQFKGSLLRPEFAIGVANADASVATALDLLNRASRAMRVAAEQPGNAIEVYNVEGQHAMDVPAGDQELLQLIDHALQNDRFKLVFQPIVGLQGNSREDYGVFVRLLSRDDEVMLPASFMEQASVSDRMSEIDRWVIRDAIKQITELRQTGRMVNLSILLSTAGILDDSLLLWICDSLREFKAKGAWLTFQIHQRDATAHLDKVETLTHGLKKINCNIALDHVLCEQEHLNLARQLEAEVVRFAPEAVAEITRSEEQSEMLKGYCEQLKKGGVRTVATGVEEAAQLAALWNIGVDAIQGHFVQEPAETIAYDFAL